MVSGSASGQQKKKSDIDELMKQAKSTSRRQGTSSKDNAKREDAPFSSKFAKMDENTFYKVMFNSETGPEEKMEQVTKALTFSDNKEDAKAKLEEFTQFKEYLQYERKRMAQQIIDLTDTEAFSELKEVYDQLNTALIDFEDKINPLTDTVDAVYELRMNGVTFDAFREITNDKEEEERIAALRAEHEEQLEKLEDDIRLLNDSIAVWGEDKAFFGLGGVKQYARENIAKAQIQLEERDTNLDDLIAKMEDETQYALPESQLDEKFIESKKKLRELLDISSDEHNNANLI